MPHVACHRLSTLTPPVVPGTSSWTLSTCSLLRVVSTTREVEKRTKPEFSGLQHCRLMTSLYYMVDSTGTEYQVRMLGLPALLDSANAGSALPVWLHRMLPPMEHANSLSQPTSLTLPPLMMRQQILCCPPSWSLLL